MATFSSSAAINFGWQTVKKNFWFFFGIMVIFFLASYLPSILAQSTGQGRSLESYAGLIRFYSSLGSLFMLVITPGIMKICLKFIKGEQSTYRDLFTSFQSVLQYLTTSIIVGLVGGLIAIVAGILVAIGLVGGLNNPLVLIIVSLIVLATIVIVFIISLKWSMAGYVAVLEGKWSLETLRRSNTLTKGNLWNLIGFMFILVGINILGAIVIMVGLLWTIPLSMLAMVHVYYSLTENKTYVA